MANVNYDTLLPDLIPMVAGCSDTMIENAVRSTVIDLCETTSIFQQQLDPITTVANIFEYDFEPPSQTVVHQIAWLSYDGKSLEPISSSLLEQREPKWRDEDQSGTPLYFIKQTQTTFWLAPVPSVSKVSGVLLRAILKPTHSSRAASAEVMNDYRDTIVNGSLYRLLRIPSQPWTDLQGAMVYLNLYNEGIETAKQRARNADGPIARKVNYGGIHSPIRKQRKNWDQAY